MNPTPHIPPGADPADFARYQQRESSRSARHSDGIEFSEVIAQLSALPPETDEERATREAKIVEMARLDRISRFRGLCPAEFMQRVDRRLLANPGAFDAAVAWDGRFPGLLLHGKTDTSKTRAAWGALFRLNTQEGRSVAWFPAKRLITEFSRYESKDLADEFWRTYQKFDVLFVDDLDKFNHQFDSECAALFAFYDWIYRDHRPCITTTNKGREWWTKLMGDAFTRRLFDDAQREIKF